MCISGSLINSTSDCCIWLIRNADDIREVVTAIKNVIGSTSAKQNGNIVGNLLPIIFKGLNGAAAQLTEIVDKVLPLASVDAEDSTTTYADLAGIWKYPTLAQSGFTGCAFYADIVNFMALHDLPTTVGDSSNEPFDLANAVAGQIFGVLAQTHATTDPSTGITILPFDVSVPAHGIDIHGAHVYYPIPLGQSQAWHSHLRLKFIRTQKVIETSEDKKKIMALTMTNKPIPPYNTTTIAVEWMSGVGTEAIMSNVQTKVASLRGYTIVASSFTDINYYFTVFTTIDIGPLAVAQAFSDALEANITAPVAAVPCIRVIVTHKSIVLA